MKNSLQTPLIYHKIYLQFAIVVFLNIKICIAQTPVPVHAGSIRDSGRDSRASLSHPQSIFVSGSYAYVVGENALEIIDISNPAGPMHTGVIKDGEGGALLNGPVSVSVSGNYAYIASRSSNMLEIVDVSNPYEPVHKSSLSLNYPTSIFVSGIYAYVIGNNKLSIVDISIPANPVLKGGIVNGQNGAVLNYPTSISVSGNNAYVGGGGSGLEVIDVSNPSAPMHKHHVLNDELENPESIFISGKYAYVASGYPDFTLEILDISNANTPVHKVGFPVDNPASVYVLGDYAYVIKHVGSLEIIDVRNPSSPFTKGNIESGTGGALLTQPTSLFVSGNYAYVTNYNNSLEIVDITNPSAPAHKESIIDGAGLPFLNHPNAVYVSGNNAYVTGNGNMDQNPFLEIINVSTPARPVHKGVIRKYNDEYIPISSPQNIAVTNNYAYVADRSEGLVILDVTNPAVPVRIGKLAFSAARALSILGNYAYVTSFSYNDGKMGAVDITNRTNPLLKGSIVSGAGGALLNGAKSIYVSGNYAYVTSTVNALEIIDISNPALPKHKGSIVNGAGGALLADPRSVFVSGNYAYVASSGSNALEIINVSNPANPVHKGSIVDGAGGALLIAPNFVYVSGNYAYVASTGSNALEIIDISNPAAPVHKASITDGEGGALLSAPLSVFVSGGYAYLVGGSNALEIISLFTPLPPVATPASSIGQTSFVANWNAVPRSTSYKLDISTDNFSTFVSGFNNSTQSGTSVNVTGLNPATTYQYRVRQVNANGASISSNVITVLTSPVATPASAPSQTGFIANWTAVAGATNYFIDVANDEAFTSIVSGYNKLSVTPNSLALTGLTSGKIYFYRIQFSKASGLSGYSNVISQITKPSNPVGLATSGATAYVFSASWNSVTGADSYELDVSQDDFQTLLPDYNSIQVFSNSKVVTGLQPNTSYRFRVRSRNTAGTSLSVTSTPITTLERSIALSAPEKTISLTGVTSLSTKLTNGTGTSEVYFYKKGILTTSTDFTDSIKVTSSSLTYEVNMISTQIDYGIEYYFTAIDNLKVLAKTGNKFAYAPIANNTKIPNLSFGGDIKNYRIISIPYKLESNKVQDLFFGVLSGYDKKYWRLVHYTNGNNTDYPAFSTMEPGNGYWFNARETVDINVGNGTAPEYNQSKPFTLTMEKGWNQIGNPYPFNISWAAVQAANPGKVSTLKVYDPETISFVETDTLKVWSGGFVSADQATDLVFPLLALKNTSPGRLATGDRVQENTDTPTTWLLPITLSHSISKNNLIGIGMHPSATLGKDAFDDVTLPRFINYLEMNTHHQEYFIPNFTKDVVPPTEQYAWNFTLNSNFENGPATLEWNPAIFENNPIQLVLYDEQTQRFIDMRITNKYSFDLSTQKKLTIYYNASEEPLTTEFTALLPPAPNPVENTTNITLVLKDQSNIKLSITDITGKAVSVIKQGNVERGIHTFEWLGNDESGQRLPGGLYLIEFKTPTAKHVKKVVLK